MKPQWQNFHVSPQEYCNCETCLSIYIFPILLFLLPEWLCVQTGSGQQQGDCCSENCDYRHWDGQVQRHWSCCSPGEEDCHTAATHTSTAWVCVLVYSCSASVVIERVLIGPILDDRLKEKILKPWKGAHSSHCVCPSVRAWTTGHIFWPRKLIFGLSNP